ncbi:circularly permuted type 2 ATP-grasp protein [Pseudochelatococcus contaminans]|uniref:Putative circularly permuted ATP-grasp superfamily protein n=1 Tax=Pseudochelatococcus contaminans TaxID=1538103 RepID=A0A7W5Z3X2_9HYPH|nr:circularly permuted type 2 ATP-grasp protein [Pseudochelatococcus contaminans]MBB3809681.1 putative circularly permuted ATP-grasp superfamily protein [Pseudochelatococcus contaminans]
MVAFDEMYGAPGAGSTRAPYESLQHWLETTPREHFAVRRSQAELFFRRIGITFSVYGEAEANERIIPFDIIPRILRRTEWSTLEQGLRQRVTALNMFLADVYGAGECIRAGIVPAELIYKNAGYSSKMAGRSVPHDLYVHIAGIDIVRVDEDSFYVLEDNVRTPSGVSYMLENREAMMRLFPELFSSHRIAPVEDYPEALLATLQSVAPNGAPASPTIALLTPGQYNSAFYEHSFLADKLGVELVEGRDLIVLDDVVYMSTTQGLRRVDVIYRRIDDEYLDPLAFKEDSVLGVPGLMDAYLAGNVTLTNAVGTGIADDKAIYSYMPEIIRFFTGEDPLLGNVPTWRCREPEALAYVLEHLHELVVKEVNGSGGYGMLVGPAATKAEVDQFRRKLKHAPGQFIAQPTLALSTCPTFVSSGIAPRHVDLRPFVLSGADGIQVVPGGLTRVALKEASLVVNSSQGGGTKDTWIIDD